MIYPNPEKLFNQRCELSATRGIDLIYNNRNKFKQ